MSANESKGGWPRFREVCLCFLFSLFFYSLFYVQYVFYSVLFFVCFPLLYAFKNHYQVLHLIKNII